MSLPPAERAFNGESNNASASCRALGVYDIVVAILAHLEPDPINDDTNCDDGDTTALATAVSVNRMWCSVGLPLLWRRPSERVLAGAAAVASPSRRAWYATHIREFRLATHSLLWFAISSSRSSGAATDDNCSAFTYDHSASLGLARKGGRGSGAMLARFVTVPLPLLETINLEMCFSCDSGISDHCYNLARRRQERLLQQLMSRHVEELTCPLAPDLVDRLEWLTGGAALPVGEEWAPLTARSEPQHQSEPRLRLRKLRLYGRAGGGRERKVDSVALERLLTWLAQSHWATPALQSVHFASTLVRQIGNASHR